MNQPVIDMMDACDRAYQITVGRNHKVILSRLQEMVEVLKVEDSTNSFKIIFCKSRGWIAEF
jgi:hypothetical protein